MSEMYQEQHPLLCDDFSEDEFNCQNYSPRSNIRMRPLAYSGRAKNQMNGAVAILTSWPEHWWSTLKYWWMGLGMVAIIVLIVYNSVIAFSMLPLTYNKIIKPRTFYKNLENSVVEEPSLEIYMHVFAGTDEEMNLSYLLPYVEIMSKRYQTYKFHLIVVINHTLNGMDEMDEMKEATRNKLAFNSLWHDEFIENSRKVIQSNLILSYVPLADYINDPAFHKINKNLPQEFIEFLVRALSIWEKGGIAFNPIILTPKTPNAIYIEKIYHILDKYKHFDIKAIPQVKTNTNHQRSHISRKKLNNIRDIIEALELEDKSYNGTQYNLTEAEDKVHSISANINNLRHVKHQNFSDSSTEHLDQTDVLHGFTNQKTRPILTSDRYKKEIGGHHQILLETKVDLNNNKPKPSLLPLFLEFLLPKGNNLISGETNVKRDTKEYYKSNGTKDFDTVMFYPTPLENDNVFNIKNNQQDEPSNYQTKRYDLDTNTQLSIDIRGYIIASNTPCHAFVGNLLSNFVRDTNGGTLTEFIIAQLTAFCKGVLFSCKGIDVILL